MATRKGIGFFRRLWHEKPDIAGTLCLCAIGLAGNIYFTMIYDKDTWHQHRFDYTVIREEDARPNLIEKGAYN